MYVTSYSSQVYWRSSIKRLWSSEERRPRILVVDDDGSLLALLRILLSSSGYDVVTASDGQKALQVIDSGPLDLILLDLEMPVMNGREFFKHYRDLGHQTPVVVVSAYGALSGKQELGAQAAVTKPFDPAVVTRLIADILGR